VASLKTLSDATFEILGQFFRRVVSILAPNGVKKIAELGNSLRRLQSFGWVLTLLYELLPYFLPSFQKRAGFSPRSKQIIILQTPRLLKTLITTRRDEILTVLKVSIRI